MNRVNSASQFLREKIFKPLKEKIYLYDAKYDDAKPINESDRYYEFLSYWDYEYHLDKQKSQKQLK